MLFLMPFLHYSHRRPVCDVLGGILRLMGSLALLDMTLVASTRWNSSRLWWLLGGFLAVGMVVSGRVLTRWLLKKMGLWIRATSILGHRDNAIQQVHHINCYPFTDFYMACYYLLRLFE